MCDNDEGGRVRLISVGWPRVLALARIDRRAASS